MENLATLGAEPLHTKDIAWDAAAMPPFLNAALNNLLYENYHGDDNATDLSCRELSPEARSVGIAMALRLYATPDQYWALAVKIFREHLCTPESGCEYWDYYELAMGMMSPLRGEPPLGACPRNPKLVALLQPGGQLARTLCVPHKAQGDCAVPPFTKPRCWWPYALGGVALGVGGYYVVRRVRARRQDRAPMRRGR